MGPFFEVKTYFLLLAGAVWGIAAAFSPPQKAIPGTPVPYPTEDVSAASPESTADAFLPMPAQAAGLGMECGSRFAFLTFDDGPSRNTGKILDILHQYDIKATFFVLGHSIEGRNDSQALLNRILDEGHYIGLHSMSHQANYLYFDEEGPMNFLEEMSQIQEWVSLLTNGFQSSLCRAPYGTASTFTKDHIDAVTSSPLHCWDWNVDSNDWEFDTPQEVLEKIKEDLFQLQRSPHAVILFHELDLSVDSLPGVIEYFLSEGFEFLPYQPASHFPLNFLGHPSL